MSFKTKWTQEFNWWLTKALIMIHHLHILQVFFAKSILQVVLDFKRHCMTDFA